MKAGETSYKVAMEPNCNVFGLLLCDNGNCYFVILSPTTL